MSISSWLARTALKMGGWQIEGSFPTSIPKYIIAVGPHTSNFDFVLGVLVRSATGLKSGFIGKKELFRFPLGYFFRWMGGYPVDRKVRDNFVQQVVDLYHSKTNLVIAIAPEGTRSETGKLKSGFYFIARQAGIPILTAGLDYHRKMVIIQELHDPAPSFEEEQERIMRFYQSCKTPNKV